MTTKTKTKIKLPNNLIDLIELAINDVRKCKADPKYTINMNIWHEPIHKDKCAVCMAGSIIAKTFKANRLQNLVPYEFGNINDLKLLIIDTIRTSWFRPTLFQELQWRTPDIDLDYYKLRSGNLHEWKRLLKDLKKEQIKYEDNETK